MHNLLQQPRAGLSKNRGLAPRLTGGELSSCVINTFIRSCIIIFGTLSEQIYQLTFYPFFVLCTYIMFMFLMYCDLHA